MSKQQTAVDWLFEELKNALFGKSQLTSKDILEQAKAIEKQQIEKAWWAGHDERDGNKMIHPSEDCNHYYNQTFKRESE